MTSIGGEKLHVDQLLKAFKNALSEAAVPCDHFRAVASADDNRYALLVESRENDPMRLAYLLHRVDDWLGELNIEYRAKRDSGRLAPPCLHLMRAGWQEGRALRRFNAGARDTQFKVALLTDAFEDGEMTMILKTIEWGHALG